MRKTVVALALALSVTVVVHAENVAPAFAGQYTLTNLGSVNGVAQSYGGMTFLDSNTLLIAGAANGGAGALYTTSVMRDASGHITGFATANTYGPAPNNDGGLAIAPNGTVLFTEYSNNAVGEFQKSSGTSSTVDLNSKGVAGSVGGLQIAPNGDLKLTSYLGGGFYTATLTEDPSTHFYNVSNAVPGISIGSGPEGFVYVPLGSSGFTGGNILIAEYSGGKVVTYRVDSNFNPIAGTDQDFIQGLGGAEGATIDPVTGDFLFSTFGGGGHIDRVSGFAAPNTPEPSSLILFGSGLAGTLGIIRRKLAK